jgi:DNA repair exonuclease SbcCD nuclease subunit
MGVTFVHTADWQLGRPYARVDDGRKRAVLQEERFRVIGRIGEVVRASGAEFVVVCGDLFDAPTVGKAVVSRACGEIGKLGVPVYVIPGNHDPGGEGGLWGQAYFQEERASLAPNMEVLLEARPVVVAGGGAVLLPCPLGRRHEMDDPLGWLGALGAEAWASLGEGARVVLAHGSVHGFGGEGGAEGGPGAEDGEDGVAGGAANRLELGRLPLGGDGGGGEVDYVALGDWHGGKRVGERAWYSGTPEADRFPPAGGGEGGGSVLVVRVVRGQSPEVEVAATGRLGWHRLGVRLDGDGDVEGLGERLAELVAGRAEQDLVRLELDGALGLAAMGRLEGLIERWRARLLRLRLVDRTVVAPTEDELAGLVGRAGDPLIGRVAGRLVELVGLGEGGEEVEVARLALRELFLAVGAGEGGGPGEGEGGRR